MTERVVIRPKNGLKIPMPGTAHLPEEARYLPEEGREFDRDLWVERRLADDEVEIVDAAPAKARRARKPPASGDTEGAPSDAPGATEGDNP